MTTAKETSLLPCIEINPNTTPTHSVIWLHGLGADGNDFVPMVNELRLPATLAIRFIFPNAPVIPVTINNGYKMRAWYDIVEINIERKIDEHGIKRSIDAIGDLIKREVSRGIPTENIIIGGFSQGAAVAMNIGLHYPEKLAGIVALSGYLPAGPASLQQASSANLTTPIFIAHGTQDPVVPFILGQAAETALKHAGYSVEWHSYPIQHTASIEEINDISGWLQRVCG